MMWALMLLLQSSDDLRTLVRRLGSEEFEVREKAARDLKRAGEAAIPLVREAAGSADLEVATRAREILAHLQWSQYFLPHQMAALVAEARGLNSGNADVRAEALGTILGKVAPASLIRRFAEDPDPKVRTLARWAALRCPDRSVAPIVVKLLAASNRREDLAVLTSDPAFFTFLGARVADDLARLAAEGTPEQRFVAALALGGDLPEAINDPDPWYAEQFLSYLGRHGRASHMALLEPMLKRDDVERHRVTAVLSSIGGPEARRILTARLQELYDSHAGTDDGLMVTVGHLEAFEAAPLIMKFLQDNISSGQALHALADMEYVEGSEAVLESARRTGSISANYLYNLGGPTVAAEIFKALRKQGRDATEFEVNLASAAENLNLADKAPECLKGLSTSEEPEFRRLCLAYLSETTLSDAVEAQLRDAINEILSRPSDALMAEAGHAAAHHGMTFRPEWKSLLSAARQDPTETNLRLMADLRCADMADAARDALASGDPARRGAACYALARLGTPDDVRRVAADATASLPLAALEAAIDSGDGPALDAVLDSLPEALKEGEWSAAVNLLSRLKHPKATAALVHAVENGNAWARLDAAQALALSTPDALPAAARKLVKLAPPWNQYFAGADAWKTPDDRVLALVRDTFEPERTDAVIDQLHSELRDGTELFSGMVVSGALRSLGALGDRESLPTLKRYLVEGDAAMSSAAADAVVDLLGAVEAVPVLRAAAAEAVNDGPILLAMVRAGDGAALRTLVQRLPTQDNHYVLGMTELNALDRAAHASAYAATIRPRRYEFANRQWGLFLRRLEADFGVPIRVSPGLQSLKTYYDSITVTGSYDLLTALELKPQKWDANVTHVHKGDHILMCTPMEAKAYWEEVAAKP